VGLSAGSYTPIFYNELWTVFSLNQYVGANIANSSSSPWTAQN